MEKQLSIKDTSWRDAPTILTTAVGLIPWKVPGTSLVLYWRDVVEFAHEFRYQYALVDESGRLITFISEPMVGDNVPYYFCKSSQGQVDADSDLIDTLVSEIGEHRVEIEQIGEANYRIVGSDYEIDTTGDYVFTPEPSDYNP